MKKSELSGGEDVKFEGKTFQIVNRTFNFGNKTKKIEIARRSPGVRLIIAKNNKMMLTREFRFELDDYDYRLPGGKVFDSLEDYKKALKSKKDILAFAIGAAKNECAEETGLIAKKVRHFVTSNAGLTVTWDLFYFIVEDFAENPEGQKLGSGEEIYPEWKTFDEIKELCLKDKINEYRSIGVIYRYFLEKEKI